MPRRIRAAVLAATALLAAGCAGQRATPAAAPSCRQPPDAVLPRTAGSLTEAEDGSYCLAVGEQLSVFLTVTAQQDHWTPVTSSDPKVLTAVGSSMLTAPIGVTPGLFRGVAAGTAQLTSSDGAGRAWRVTIVVR